MLNKEALDEVMNAIKKEKLDRENYHHVVQRLYFSDDADYYFTMNAKIISLNDKLNTLLDQLSPRLRKKIIKQLER